MGKEILTYGDIKTVFKPYFLEDEDIQKVLVTKKIFPGEKDYKYFTGYLYDDYKVKSLYKMLPKTNAYVKRYDGKTKRMYFSIEDDVLLEKYNTIWDEDIKKQLMISKNN